MTCSTTLQPRSAHGRGQTESCAPNDPVGEILMSLQLGVPHTNWEVSLASISLDFSNEEGFRAIQDPGLDALQQRPPHWRSPMRWMRDSPPNLCGAHLVTGSSGYPQLGHLGHFSSFAPYYEHFLAGMLTCPASQWMDEHGCRKSDPSIVM